MKALLCSFTVLFFGLFCLSQSVQAQCVGTVYMTSWTWQTPTMVHGYSSTDLDYCAGLYYDPATWGRFSEGNWALENPRMLNVGYTEGYADWIPAQVYSDYPCPRNSEYYNVDTTHYVIEYYQVYVCYMGCGYYWYDPWQLGFLEAGGGYEAPGLYGFGYVNYWISSPPRAVGNTFDTTIYTGPTQCQPPGEPTPTPTPPPPPPPPPTVTLESIGFKNDLKIKRLIEDAFGGADTLIDPIDNQPTWTRDYSVSYPAAYVNTSSPTPPSPTAFASFTLMNANSNYSSATIRIREYQNVYATIPNVNISSNGQFSINNIALNNLPFSNKVGANAYNFIWEVSFDGGINWTTIGLSPQIIHWLYAYSGEPSFESDPSGPLPLVPYSGLYDVALENSTGAISGLEVATPSEIARILTQHIANTLIYNPGRPSNAQNPLNVFLPESSKDVQCSANANILMILLKTVGITNGEMKYYYGGNNSRENDYRHIKNDGREITASLQVKRLPTDELELDPHFTFHVTVILPDGKSYDPSYGVIEDQVDIYTAINNSGVCKYGAEANILKIIKTPSEFRATPFWDFGISCDPGGLLDNSSFISQSLDSSMQIGQSYPISITMINTGTTTWKNSEGYQLGSNPPNNINWGTYVVSLPNEVLPGQTVTFNFNVTAPSTPGNYDFQWRMLRNGVLQFGASTPNMLIEVSSPNECSYSEERACNRWGGNWNPMTCTCEGGY